jgi:hypothetical protein
VLEPYRATNQGRSASAGREVPEQLGKYQASPGEGVDPGEALGDARHDELGALNWQRSVKC